MKIEDESRSVGNGYSRVRKHAKGWTTGEVVTPHGFVLVSADGCDKVLHRTSLSIALAGRLHTRVFYNKRYTYRGIALKAKQFAKEIYEAQQSVAT